MRLMSFWLSAVIAAFAAQCARAEMKPQLLFSDNAALRRGTSVPVRGTATGGERVTVFIHHNQEWQGDAPVAASQRRGAV